MALINFVYLDIGLTDQFDDSTDVLGAQAVNGSANYGVFYVGTPTAGNKVEDSTSPGTADITVSIVDTSPGSGVEASHIKLSATDDFTGSVAGDPLTLGTTINHGSPAAVYYQWTNSVGGGDYTDITIDITAMAEFAQ